MKIYSKTGNTGKDEHEEENHCHLQEVHFPDGVLLEILYKLPVDSIVRLKRVSKQWLSLISDPSFPPFYVSRTRKLPPWTLLFKCSYASGIAYHVSSDHSAFNDNPNFPFPSENFPNLIVEASSSDLLLCQSKYRNITTYSVLNPFTKQCVTLPPIASRSQRIKGFISELKTGLKSYKVVLVSSFSHDMLEDTESTLQFEIYSSEVGEWSNSKVRIPGDKSLDLSSRKCIPYRGFLHWIDKTLKTIVAIDLSNSSNHQCTFIDIPSKKCIMNGINGLIDVSKDSICYFEMNDISIKGNEFPGWNLWVLKDYDSGTWNLAHEARRRKIGAFGVLSAIFTSHSPFIPLAFSPSDSEIVYILYERYILTLNLQRGWFEDEVHCLPTNTLISPWPVFTLVLPFCPTQIPDQP